MLALLKKDISGVARQSWTFPILLVAVFVIVYSLFGSISGEFLFVGILSVLFVVSAAGYDDRSRFTVFGLSMPVSRVNYALCRYVFGFLTMIAGSLLLFAIAGVMYLINPELLGDGGFGLVVSMFFFSLCLTAILLSIIVPLTLRFSHAVARMVLFALILIPFLAAWMAGEGSQLMIPQVLNDNPVLIGGGISLVLLVVSVLLSLRIAKKREYPIV